MSQNLGLNTEIEVTVFLVGYSSRLLGFRCGGSIMHSIDGQERKGLQGVSHMAHQKDWGLVINASDSTLNTEMLLKY